MIALVVVLVLVVFLGVVAFARLSSSRAERRSVRSYGHTLDVLGDMSKRSEQPASVHHVEASEASKTHVRPRQATDRLRPAPEAVRRVPPARVRLQPPVLPGSRTPLPEEPDASEEAPVRPFDPLEPEGVSPMAVEEAPPARSSRRSAAAARGLAARRIVPEAPTVFDGGAFDGGAFDGGVFDGGGLEAESEGVELIGPVAPMARPIGPVPTGPTRPELAPEAPAEDERTVVEVPVPILGGATTAEEQLLADGGPPTEAIPVFDDAGGEILVASPTPPRQLRGLQPHRDHVMRRTATGAAAAVVLGALAVGGYELASQHHPTTAGSPPLTTATRTTTPPAHGSHTGGTTAPKTTAPKTTTPKTTTPKTGTSSSLQPTSTSSSLVAYDAPGKSYQVTFDVTGTSDCWLGIERQANGPYLWMETLQPGATYTYQASGPIVIRIGAPPQLSIQVDGKKVALPAANVNAYDMTLTPGNQSSA